MHLIFLIGLAVFLKFFVLGTIIDLELGHTAELIIILISFAIGLGYIFQKTADTIEETTDVLKDRTGLAGGLLQAIGTAFPDMIIGIIAAMLALQAKDTDPARAVNLAILATAATFGSNIYNIAHAAWCVHRQNLANKLKTKVSMFPPFEKFGGKLIPVSEHSVKPAKKELDNAISVLVVLSLLTAFVAIAMVMFGVVRNGSAEYSETLYRLTVPSGFILFLLCIYTLFHFRKSHHPESPVEEIAEAETYYHKQKTYRIWLDLASAGIAILITAEAMVKMMEMLSHILSMPFIVTGILAGIIGCFGEMMVVHNFSIHPKGRIGDAVTGVAMDNIFTTVGAAIVAIMGGIFLGSGSLIIIFITIIALNTVLIGQITKLRNNI